MNIQNIDWKTAGFSYRKTNSIFVATYKDGAWDEGVLQEDDHIPIHVSASSLHYGQQCFEGLKAYRRKDGRVQLFRPDENAKRLNRSASRLLMPEVDEDFFIQSVKRVVKANEEFVPPYGSGGSLYIRPVLIGVGANLGVKPAAEYKFIIFVCPVGAYFKDGLSPVKFVTTDYDRAAPRGTGKAKVGGNYAGSMLAHKEAAEAGYADCIYLDPATQTKIEEVGAANFFGITADKKYITPTSPSILASITNLSLRQLARDMEYEVIETDVMIDEIDHFVEAGACGTAAVITPIASITHKGKETIFYDLKEVGPVTQELYNTLTGIQSGDLEDTHDWTVLVD